MFKEIMAKSSKFDLKKPRRLKILPRSSTNFKLDKHRELHTETF